VKRAVVAPLTIIVALLLASPSGAISIKAAGRQYLEDVAPANAALHSFNTAIDAWTDATPDAVGERQAASTLAALRLLQRRLLSQRWPQSVVGGVQFIVREDISSLEEDMTSVTGNSSLGNGALRSTFQADTHTIDAHAFYLRQDLGLPSGRNL
jgi:hypothetical protein